MWCFRFVWYLNFSSDENRFLQALHSTPWIIITCLLNPELQQNNISHLLQLYCFSVCAILMCLFRRMVLSVVNGHIGIGHTILLTTINLWIVWRCLLRLNVDPNFFPQSLHLKTGFSFTGESGLIFSLQLFKCLWTFLLCLITMPQPLQCQEFASWQWLSAYGFFENVLPHFLHW